MALTELESLQLFMQDRVRAYDPTIDTTGGSSFDTEVIQPLLQRYSPDAYNTAIREFILTRLRSEFPDLVISPGEPIDDLVVKPMQVLLEPFRRQIQQISNNQSLANPDTLSDVEADNLGANYFVNRHLGGSAVGVARLYYSAPQFASVTPANSVFTGDGLKFLPVENQAISADSMLFNVEDNLYYFDIVVRAEAEGADYNIPTNMLVGIDGATQVIKITNKITFEEGADRESTADFVARIQQSLTEKSLVTIRGIDARIREIFESVQFLQVIGFGDPEMQRDILKGTSETTEYAAAYLNCTAGNFYVDLYTTGVTPIIGVDGTPHSSFLTAGVVAGDLIEFAIHGTGAFYQHTVRSVEATRLWLITVSTYTGLVAGATLRRPTGKITISDIPGGILVPNPPAGEIVINDNEVHIGGALDVFLRGTSLQAKTTDLSAIKDEIPLYFGIDLESFGADVDGQVVHVSEAISAEALIPARDRYGASVTDHIVVAEIDSGLVPWKLTEEDKGRFIQILGGTNEGTFEITEILGEEYYVLSNGTAKQVVRAKVSLFDIETNVTLANLPVTSPEAFSVQVRIGERVSVQARVRDRDGSRSAGPISGVAGIDFSALGAKVGDSLVIETGDDAGIYSIRRILSSLASNDTLLLDRNLTDTIMPTGTGDGSGLRYRIDDELNVDLINPKVMKIPLGSIFAGEDLSTVPGFDTVTATGSTNFLMAAVMVGDTLEIREGSDKGTYQILEVTGLTLRVSAPMSNAASNLLFAVYTAFTGVSRPLIRVKDVELLDVNAQPTGSKIPYGDVIDARVHGPLSNRAEGTNLESFTGELQGANTLYDASIDFVAQGVTVGNRVNVFNSESVGHYTVKAVLGANTLTVIPVAEGGISFIKDETSVHYSIGYASSGYARLYFLEPTSIEISTGIAGGRLGYEEGGVTKEFRFSEVDGYNILPAGGSEESVLRDLRVVRSYSSNRTIVELTDPSLTSVFDLEVQVGDLLKVYEQLPFRKAGGNTLFEVGIYGKPAGLRTVAGSNRVSIPGSSSIDFQEMDNVYPLIGQTLYIDSGPDQGSYIIEEVVSSKVLRLNRILTSTTEATLGQDAGTPRDGYFNSSGYLVDTTDGSQFGAQLGQYVTIFESLRPDMDGTYEILSFPTPGQVVELDHSITNPSCVRTLTGDQDDGATLAAPTSNFTDGDATFQTDRVRVGDIVRVLTGGSAGQYRIAAVVNETTLTVSPQPTAAAGLTYQIESNDFVNQGYFSWVRTALKENVGRDFRIYKTVPTEVEVLQVATKRANVTSIASGTATGIYTWASVGHGAVSEGDLLEVLSGPNAGIYVIASSATNTITIRTNLVDQFIVDADPTPYIVWGGLHGSTRMLTVGPFEGSSGVIPPGELLPYRLVRRNTARVCSTVMETQKEGALYYVDIQIESEGSGDEWNLLDDSRLTVTNGVSVDGYTYSVGNPTLTFSMYEDVSLKFDRRFLPVGNTDLPENRVEVSGRNLRIAYEASSLVQTVNDLLRSDADRPVNASPIARHFLPSYVYVEFLYRGGVPASDVGPEIEDYINRLGGSTELEVSDLEAFLTRRGATSIQHPITLISVTHDLERKLIATKSQNKIGGLSPVSFSGTGRITAFITSLGETLLVTRG